MKRMEWKDHDRSEWQRGEWDNEPDKIQWKDDATQFPCLMVRNHFGAWCGYVGVSKGHSMHGKSYDDGDFAVHGGLTFAGPCQEGDAAHTVCHIVDAGEDDDVWWLGFDTAHASDQVPRKMLYDRGDKYRNVAYVTGECEDLARQLYQAEHGPS